MQVQANIPAINNFLLNFVDAYGKNLTLIHNGYVHGFWNGIYYSILPIYILLN